MVLLMKCVLPRFIVDVFVATIFLSQQAYFCRDKRTVLSRQTRVCFVAKKMILVAAAASDSYFSVPTIISHSNGIKI